MSQENNNNDGKDNKDKDNKNKKMRQRIMDRQGFYTILILCLIIVGATALWVDNQKGSHFIGEGPTSPFGDEEEPEVTLVEDDDKDVGEAEETGKIGEGKSAVDKKTPIIDSKQKPKHWRCLNLYRCSIQTQSFFSPLSCICLVSLYKYVGYSTKSPSFLDHIYFAIIMGIPSLVDNLLSFGYMIPF
jgi:hypothetical protein